jgi:hypothetical protein
VGLFSPLCRTCNITRGLAFIALCVSAPLLAQDVKLGVTYVCSGEHITIDSCNIRDTSDTANCMVGHPGHIQPNGLMQYTYATRGALKMHSALAETDRRRRLPEAPGGHLQRQCPEGQRQARCHQHPAVGRLAGPAAETQVSR